MSNAGAAECEESPHGGREEHEEKGRQNGDGDRDGQEPIDGHDRLSVHLFAEERAMSDGNFEKFKSCAVEVLHVPEDKVVPEANFADDLEADSLDLVELVMALEEAFNITVDESELEGIETVGQAYDLISAKV